MPTILIVDDDDILRESIADVVREAGYQVIEARAAATALEILDEISYEIDLVLSDVKMPGMDGLEFLQIAHTNYPGIAFVMLTGHGDVPSAVEAMRNGAHNYLLKPARKDDILASIEDALQRRQKTLETQSLMHQVVANLQQLGIVSPDTNIPITVRYLRAGDLVLDQHRLTAQYRDYHLDLTPTELEILQCLMRVAPRVVSFEAIVFQIQNIQAERDEARSMVSTHVSNLRAKMREAGCDHYLVNSRGYGYYINVDVV